MILVHEHADRRYDLNLAIEILLIYNKTLDGLSVSIKWKRDRSACADDD